MFIKHAVPVAVTAQRIGQEEVLRAKGIRLSPLGEQAGGRWHHESNHSNSILSNKQGKEKVYGLEGLEGLKSRNNP